MIRIDVMIREDQEESLSHLPGSTSELVREAIDDLIKKKTPKARTSPSKRGGGASGDKS